MGRPSTYSEELGAEVCAAVAEHGSLTKALEAEPNLPCERTIYRWLATNEGFRQSYVRAREVGDEADVAEMRRIAMDKDVPSDQKRVMVDVIKWELGRRSPKKWGDKVQTEHSGGVELTHREARDLTDDELAAVIAKHGG